MEIDFLLVGFLSPLPHTALVPSHLRLGISESKILYPPIVDVPVYKVHEFVMVYIVEKLFEVDIHYIGISVIEVLKQFHNCTH